MREIKFSAYEKATKQIIPVYNIDFEKKMINTNSAWRMFHEIELMQFTDKKDDNGVEIYEGNIVVIKYIDNGEEATEIKEVIRDGCNGYSPLNWETYCDSCDNSLEISSIKVIGNIYQNLELIQVN